MKTQVNFPENGMVNNLDALIFANRNKAYGAFELRKKYQKHLFIAFSIAFFLFATGISVPLIHARFFNKVINVVPRNDDPRKVSKLEVPLDVPPPKPVEIPNAIQNRFRPFIVSNSDENPDEIMTVDDWTETETNDFDTLALVQTTSPVDAYFDPDKGDGVVFVQENATFQGGDLRSFQYWIQHNVVYPAEAANANIQGKVYIEFCVNTKGDVCDIKIMRGLHPSIDDECIRALLNSPKWTPAKQNGKLVKQKFSLPISFILAG